MENIDKTIENLKSSPLYYLFISSRELFHTNFWLWLSTINKTETLKLFTKKKSVGSLKYKREHNQSNGGFKSKVDLFISDDNRPIVAIENKILDFPTIQQLERIKNSFGNQQLEYIVTTLFWNQDMSFDGWTVKTYKELSNEINAKNFTTNNYHLQLINDYKEFTYNLAILAEQIEVGQNYDFAMAFNSELFHKLNEIKIWEGYQKLRASHLIDHFNKTNDHNVISKYAVNGNKKSVLDFVVELKNGYNIGIQIEDKQYRKFITGKKYVEFSDNLKVNNLFFSNNWLSPRKLKLMSYKPDFKYQYEIIDVISFKELFEKINNDISTIKVNIEKIEALIPNNF